MFIYISFLCRLLVMLGKDVQQNCFREKPSLTLGLFASLTQDFMN